MMGQQDRDQGQLFYEFKLDDVIPRNHLLRRMNVFVTTALADLAIEKLAPIRAEILRLSSDPAYTDAVLAKGAEKARVIARPNMEAIKDILGLVR